MPPPYSSEFGGILGYLGGLQAWNEITPLLTQGVIHRNAESGGGYEGRIDRLLYGRFACFVRPHVK
jgi:hypothetical protein